jgi:hypothetical protein
MELSASWLRRIARRHTLCAHPTDLSCLLIGRWREVAERYVDRTQGLTLARMGVPRARKERQHLG